MFVGRAREREHLRGFLHRVSEGEGGLLVVEGEAGVGKTALCEVELAELDAGVRWTRVTCLEGDSAIPYATLHEVFSRLPRFDVGDAGVSSETVAWLRGDASGPSPTPLDAARATLVALAAVGADGPFVLLVDDLPWADGPSADALLFAARRLGHDPVGLLVTVRGPAQDPLDLAGAQRVRLDGLSSAEIADLLAALTGVVPADRVVGEVARRTGGNALVVRAVAADLTEGQVLGGEPLPVDVGADVVGRLTRGRLDAVGPDLRLALLVAACSRDGAVGPVAGAVQRLGLSADESLSAMESTGLVIVDGGRVSFSHPLVREACRAASSPAERRRCHAALAEAVAGDDRTWHLAGAALGPDERVASALEDLADRLARSGAHDQAALAYDRATELSEGPEARDRRLFGAGRSHQICGRLDVSEERLVSALSLSDTHRSEIQLLRGNILTWRGEPDAACALLIAEADRLADQPYQAATLLFQAVVGLIHDGRFEAAAVLAGRVQDLGRQVGEPFTAAADAIAGYTTALLGDPEGEGLVLDARDIFDAIEPLAEALPIALAVSSFVGLMLVHVEAYDLASRMLDGTITAARRIGATSQLTITLVHRAELELRRGRWTTAARDADEALQYAQAGGQPVGALLDARARVAQVAVHRMGDQDPAALRSELADVVDTAETRRHVPAFGDALRAAGLLELTVGAPEAAAIRLGDLDRFTGERGLGHAGISPFLADLADARFRAGDHAGAQAVLDRLRERAKPMRGRRGVAAATRIEGLLLDDVEVLREAVALHDVSVMPFERARALLDLGARLRRGREVRAARAPLHEAQQLFETLGAPRWEAKVAEELRAAGERGTAPRAGRPTAALTPQELRIASLVAAGGTNREVAAELFLSPKTVENHLGRIYAKLGVRSRTEMARHLADEDR